MQIEQSHQYSIFMRTVTSTSKSRHTHSILRQISISSHLNHLSTPVQRQYSDFPRRGMSRQCFSLHDQGYQEQKRSEAVKQNKVRLGFKEIVRIRGKKKKVWAFTDDEKKVIKQGWSGFSRRVDVETSQAFRKKRQQARRHSKWKQQTYSVYTNQRLPLSQLPQSNIASAFPLLTQPASSIVSFVSSKPQDEFSPVLSLSKLNAARAGSVVLGNLYELAKRCNRLKELGQGQQSKDQAQDYEHQGEIQFKQLNYDQKKEIVKCEQKIEENTKKQIFKKQLYKSRKDLFKKNQGIFAGYVYLNQNFGKLGKKKIQKLMQNHHLIM